MKYFLATTAIYEYWDRERDLLLLGPWCILGDKNKIAIGDKPYSVMQSPWKPAINLKTASFFCLDAYNEIMTELSEQLNLLHGIKQPEKYWRILIGPWLLHFIEILYDRFKRIENVFAIFPDTITFSLPKSRCQLVAVDTYDLVSRKSIDDNYNLQIFSLIMNYFYPSSSIEKDLIIDNPEVLSSGRGKLIKKIFYFSKNLKNVFSEPKIILSDMYNLSWEQMLFLEMKCLNSGVVFKNFDYQPLNINKRREEERKKIGFSKQTDRFKEFLRKMIPSAIPLCYIENFREYKKRVEKSDLKAIGSSVGWYFNESFKFAAAELFSKNVRLLNFQYGGGYGMSLVTAADAISLESDRFYTWGWSSKNKTKILPSPYLSRLANSYSKRADNLLYITTSIPQYTYRLHTVLQPEDIAKYNKDKLVFLNDLTEDTRRKLIYKHYIRDYGFNEKKAIERVFPNLNFARKEKAVNLMKRVNLVVIDHPYTSFLEALVINVPSVFYWDHDVCLMNPETDKYLDLLRSLGIVHRDPISAAKKVNEVFDNPIDWWSGEDVQKARSEFCEHFAYSTIDWADKWHNEFKNIISGN